MAGLTLTTDVRLTLWQDLSALSFTFSDMTTPRETVTLDYADSVGVRVGATYRFWRDADGEPRLAVRAGVGWEQAPTAPAATSPLLPDGDRTSSAPAWAPASASSPSTPAISPRSRRSARPGGTFGARYRSVTHTVSLALTFRLPNFPSRL